MCLSACVKRACVCAFMSVCPCVTEGEKEEKEKLEEGERIRKYE